MNNKTTTAPRQDAVQRYGATAIGGRLRRLSERIDQDCARIYADLGVRFEQRWFGVLSQLANGGPQSVGALAASLGITHASVSQTRRSLHEAGLVETSPDDADARSVILRLSPPGKRLFKRLSPVWKALDEVSVELNAEASQALKALDLLDQALNRMSLYERFEAHAGKSRDR
ncbi:MAG: MarR family winged helix-turn-helix transcriptional regulator [Burkholderiaceae bacterium]